MAKKRSAQSLSGKRSRDSSIRLAKSRLHSSSHSLGLHGSVRPTSVTSIASQYNQSTGRFTGRIARTESMKQAVKDSLQVDSYGQSLYDCVLVYLRCPTHNRIALSAVERRLFLPYAPIYIGETWLNSAATLINRILDLGNKVNESRMFTEPTLVDILRVQVPIYFQLITRVTYQARLTKHACRTGLCAQRDRSMIAWFDIDSLKTNVKNAETNLGPEMVLFESLANAESARCREITILDALLYQIGAGKRKPQGKLLTWCGYSEDDVLHLYGDYLQHCYPSEFMSYGSFENYLRRAELKLCKPDKLPATFRAFAFNHTGDYINFHEFLLGFAMIDKLNGIYLDRSEHAAHPKPSSAPTNSDSSKKIIKSAKHHSRTNLPFRTSSPTAGSAKDEVSLDELCGHFIFRFYAKSGANTLTEDEFVHALNALKIPADEVTKLKHSHCKIGVTGGGGSVKQSHFVSIAAARLVQDGGAPITIFNACDVSTIDHLTIKSAYPPINFKQVKKRSDRVNAIQAKLARARELCANCRLKRYTLSAHLVKMSRIGVIHDPTPNKQRDVERMLKPRRVLSEHYFMSNYVCNRMIDMVRRFAAKLHMYKPDRPNIDAPDWIVERHSCVEKIEKICDEARGIFERCDRVVKVVSPCYAVGDIHGNLRDLLIYEKVIWRHGAYFNTANFLFLGDYVDRGEWSIECILYLLCAKLLAPDRIFMLRGNHESRALQREFTFYRECLDKFGQHDGERVFEAFNRVFDRMPLCAIIDEQIYCAHGGIPSSANKIEQILLTPCPLFDPDNQSIIAMEILWNDPITNQEYTDLMHNNEAANSARQLPKGFLDNTKRGTGCFFSETALSNFMAGNSISHIIRAHEVIPAGYQYHAGGRCVTIFSCSYYCDGINEAAVALVHDSKIRVVKIDTGTKEEAQASAF